MPIKPENKSRYPKNWKEIRERILKRANNRCEFCGVENHTYRRNPKTGKDAYIVLTIAHLDHTPENCSDDNLKALCQRCHNRYDAEHRKQTRKGNFADGEPFGINIEEEQMMKARLAKKLAHTPFDRLAPYWINKFVCKDGRDARFEKAIAKWNKREQ